MSGRRPRSVYGVGDDPDPRFSLANERTALAGIRTSVAVIAAGVGLAALVHLASVPDVLRYVAFLLCLAGGGLALSTVVRWRRVERSLRLAQPLPPPFALAPVAIVILALGLGAAAIALVVAGG
jgi:putative membrane protein